jgi:hypothetical protein
LDHRGMKWMDRQIFPPLVTGRGGEGGGGGGHQAGTHTKQTREAGACLTAWVVNQTGSPAGYPLGSAGLLLDHRWGWWIRAPPNSLGHSAQPQQQQHKATAAGTATATTTSRRTHRYIFAVLPSSSGKHSSGFVTGYATGIWGRGGARWSGVDIGGRGKVGRGGAKWGEVEAPLPAHTATKRTSNSRSNSYFSWL